MGYPKQKEPPTTGALKKEVYQDLKTINTPRLIIHAKISIALNNHHAQEAAAPYPPNNSIHPHGTPCFVGKNDYQKQE